MGTIAGDRQSGVERSVKFVQANFSAGQVDKDTIYKQNAQRYQNGLLVCKNMVLKPQGGLKARPLMRAGAETPNKLSTAGTNTLGFVGMMGELEIKPKANVYQRLVAESYNVDSPDALKPTSPFINLRYEVGDTGSFSFSGIANFSNFVGKITNNAVTWNAATTAGSVGDMRISYDEGEVTFSGNLDGFLPLRKYYEAISQRQIMPGTPAVTGFTYVNEVVYLAGNDDTEGNAEYHGNGSLSVSLTAHNGVFPTGSLAGRIFRLRRDATNSPILEGPMVVLRQQDHFRDFAIWSKATMRVVFGTDYIANGDRWILEERTVTITTPAVPAVYDTAGRGTFDFNSVPFVPTNATLYWRGGEIKLNEISTTGVLVVRGRIIRTPQVREINSETGISTVSSKRFFGDFQIIIHDLPLLNFIPSKDLFGIVGTDGTITKNDSVYTAWGFESEVDFSKDQEPEFVVRRGDVIRYRTVDEAVLRTWVWGRKNNKVFLQSSVLGIPDVFDPGDGNDDDSIYVRLPVESGEILHVVEGDGLHIFQRHQYLYVPRQNLTPKAFNPQLIARLNVHPYIKPIFIEGVLIIVSAEGRLHIGKYELDAQRYELEPLDVYNRVIFGNGLHNDNFTNIKIVEMVLARDSSGDAPREQLSEVRDDEAYNTIYLVQRGYDFLATYTQPVDRLWRLEFSRIESIFMVSEVKLGTGLISRRDRIDLSKIQEGKLVLAKIPINVDGSNSIAEVVMNPQEGAINESAPADHYQVRTLPLYTDLQVEGDVAAAYVNIGEITVEGQIPVNTQFWLVESDTGNVVSQMVCPVEGNETIGKPIPPATMVKLDIGHTTRVHLSLDIRTNDPRFELNRITAELTY